MYVGGHNMQHAITESSKARAVGIFCSPDLPSDKGYSITWLQAIE